jgi:hypothetical protein
MIIQNFNSMVSISYENYDFSTTFDAIWDLINKKRSMLAISDETNNAVIILSFTPTDNTYLTLKSLKKGLTDTIIPISQFSEVIGKRKEILEKKYGEGKNFEDLVLLEKNEQEKMNQAKLIEKEKILLDKYVSRKSLDFEDYLEINKKRRREYLQRKFGNDKPLQDLERLEAQDNQREKRDSRKSVLEKKFGTEKSLEQLELLEREEVRKKYQSQKFGKEKTIEELERLEFVEKQQKKIKSPIINKDAEIEHNYWQDLCK